MAGKSNSRGGGTSQQGGLQPATARLVGRIVDPAVREDGRAEPQVSPGPGGRRGAALVEPGKAPGHPIRDRLLARAAMASQAEPNPGACAPAVASDLSAGDSSTLSGVRDRRPGSGEGSTAGVTARRTPGGGVELEMPCGNLDSLPELTDDLDTIGLAEDTLSASESERSDATASGSWLRNVFTGVAVFAVLFCALSQAAPREPLGQALRQGVGGSQAIPQQVALLGEDEVVRDQADDTERQPGKSVVEEGPSSPSRQAARKTADEAGVERDPERPFLAEPSESKSVRTTRPVTRVRRGPWRIEWIEGDPRLRTIRKKVGKDSLLASLQTAGVGLSEGFRIVKAFEGVRNFDRCRPRDEYLALVDSDSGRLKAFEYIVSDEEIYQAREGDDGLLRGELLDLQVKRRRAAGVIVLDGDFDASARRAGFEPGLESRINKALAGYTDISRMKPGEVLALVAQEVTVLGDFYRYAGVEALEYRRVGAEPVRVYYHDVGKTRGYVDTDGRMFGIGRWAKPVRGAPRTSKFNPRRLHPILKVVRPHNGTDYGAPSGTPVMAAADGRVTYVGKMGPNGNFVRLTHPGGYETGYSHLSRFARRLKRGATVTQHQVIGYVGTTGRSTGPHLHFSAKKRGKFIDPESLDLDAFARLPVSDRRQLKRLRKRYDELLAELKIPPATVAEPRRALAKSAVGSVSRRSVLAALRPAEGQGSQAAEPVALPIYLSAAELMAALPAASPTGHSADVHSVDQAQ